MERVKKWPQELESTTRGHGFKAMEERFKGDQRCMFFPTKGGEYLERSVGDILLYLKRHLNWYLDWKGVEGYRFLQEKGIIADTHNSLRGKSRAHGSTLWFMSL